MRSVFLVTLLLGGTPLYAGTAPQSAQLSGVVRDASGLPMASVDVTLSGPGDLETTTATSDAGSYQFAIGESGRYRLRARKSGFREVSQSVSLQSGTSLQVDITMQPGFTQVLIVTASRTPESILTTPASVTVLDSKEIAASPADGFADLLRGVPGLNITQFGARDIEINARGSTGILSNSTLVMLDGRSFFQPLYGAVYWDLATVSKDEIDQIEIVRSPASAVWGANALSGVINLRTKSPREMKGMRGNLGFGERGTKSAGVNWADATDRMSYKLSGSYFEQDAWDRDNTLPDGSPMPPTVLFQNRGTKQPKFDARVDFDADRRQVWSVRGGVAGANGLIHSALGPAEFEAGSYASYVQVDRTSDDLDLKVYWNRLDAPFRVVLFGLDEDATNDTFVGELTRHATKRQHRLTYGGSVRFDRFDVTIAPDDHGRLNGGAFIEDQVSVGPTLNFVLGGRLDKFDTTGAVFAPRVGAVVTPGPGHSFRVTYNRSFRAPSLLENFVSIALPTYVPLNPPFFYSQFSLGSTDLEMEKQDAIEAGYTASFGSRAIVSATLYNQVVANKIWFLPVSFYGPGAPPPGWPGDPNAVPVLPKAFSFVNLAQVRDRGLELATKVEWPSVSLQGSYTYQDLPRLEDNEGLPLQINRPAKHQAGGGLTYATNRWTAEGDVHYTGRAFWADVFTEQFWGSTDAYVAVNSRVSYRQPLRPWELWISATDLFDSKIKSHVFGDTIRRNVTGGVRWLWDQ